MLKKLIKFLNSKVLKNYTIVPVNPPRELLVSMAIRDNHGFGFSCGFTDEEIREQRKNNPMFNYLNTKEERENILSSFRQIHEEVVGTGFYEYWDEENNRKYRM